jgi:hypothetical protein
MAGTQIQFEPDLFLKPLPVKSNRPRRQRSGTLTAVAVPAELLNRHVDAWKDLAANAIETNVFYEHWMLLPALELFSSRRNEVVLVFSSNESIPETQRLCGVFPLHRVGPGVLMLWQYIHCYLCTPLIRKDNEDGCVAALLEWLSRDGTLMIGGANIYEDSLFYRLLVEHAAAAGNSPFIWQRTARPVLRPSSTSETYFAEVLSSTKRRKLRNQEQRLAKLGKIEYATLKRDDDVEGWVSEFLRLEASGWKGRAGTALRDRPDEREFFREIAKGAQEARRLMMLALRLNGRDIAQLCNFVTDDGAFAFKVAFDESYAKYSPGVLLELENVRQTHLMPGIPWMDSCTSSSASPVQYLWPHRRNVQTFFVATDKWQARLLTPALPALRWGARKGSMLRELSLRELTPKLAQAWNYMATHLKQAAVLNSPSTADTRTAAAAQENSQAPQMFSERAAS